MPRTLGIDLGTSGVRAIIADETGVLASASMSIDPDRRRDPGALWAAVTTVMDQLDLSNVSALAVDGTSGTILPVAQDGSPVGRLSLYNEVAPESYRTLVAGQASPDSAARGSTSPLARAVLLQATTQASRVLHEADWIAGQLCGRFDVTDQNNALKTGYDPIEQDWPDWIDSTALPRSLLPDVVASGTRIAFVTAQASRRFGLRADTVVAAGTTDGCASFLATGANQPGDGVTALGSTMTLKLLSAVPVFSFEYGIYSHHILGRWLPGGASNAGGAVLAQFFTPEQLTLLSQRIDPTRASQCDFYPLPAPGERFPVNDATLAPRLTPRPADDAVFLHGLLESLARIEALGYRRLAELGSPPLRQVLTMGGGGTNPTWTAIRSRVLGVPVHAAATDAAYGAALLARAAL